MARMKVLAGDFLHGSGDYHDGVMSIETPLYPWPGIKIKVTQIKAIEIVGEESSRSITTALLQGLAGGVVLGPLGALAGFVLTDENQEVSFLATLKDERKIMATVDKSTYAKIAAQVGRSITSGKA